MKKPLIYYLLASSLLTLACLPAQADVLASYPFAGFSLTSTDTDLVSVASPINLGAGLTDSSTSRFGGVSNPYLRVNADETDGTTREAAIANNDLFSFTLSPNSGNRLNLQTLTFSLATSSTALSTDVFVQGSVNGGSYSAVSETVSYSNPEFSNVSVDISYFNYYPGMANGAPIVLRFAIFDNSSDSAAYTAFDDITINGTITAVPEPSNWVLLTFAGAWMLGRTIRATQHHQGT